LLKIYNENGLPFWNEHEIELRNYLIAFFAREINVALLEMNPAWKMHRIEAPILTPIEFINENYGPEDVFIQDTSLVLRPETTAGSYQYAKHLMNTHSGTVPPFVVWQAGKSFRRETDHVEKHMRLKEFYQQEFQCFYASDTLNDYHGVILQKIYNMFEKVLKQSLNIVPSDRLPGYSLNTIDIEALQNPGEFMELCSVSVRNDFTEKAKFTTKKGTIEKDLLVLEIAIGLDRIIYNS